MLNLKSKWVKLSAGFGAGAVLLWASGIAPQAYNLIEGNGTPAARGSTLNFANTASVTWSCTTTGIVTACSATASGGGSGGGIVTLASAGLLPAGTQYVPIGGGSLGAPTTTEAQAQVGAPSAATISSMFVTLSAAPGLSNSIAFTWRKAGASQTLTCTISGAVAVSCSDTTHSFTVAQGDLIDIQLVTTGTIVTSPAPLLTIATAYGTTGTAGYLTVQNNGTPLPQEPVLNIINGTNTTAVCADNPGNTSTDCKVNASGGGAGGFIQPLTAPVSANFSQLNFNNGTGVVTTQVNNSTPVTSITLNQLDPNSTQETAAIVKNKIAATFTVTVGFSDLSSSNAGLVGLFLYDGSSNNLFWGYQSQASLRGPVFSDLAGTFSTDAVGQYSAAVAGPLAWFRIQETASARNYLLSSDGINFFQVATESNTAHFTTAQYGWAVQSRSGGPAGTQMGITVYSFTETNP